MSNYSQKKAMGKRFICSQGIMSFRSLPSVIISNHNEERDIIGLPLCKRKEIYEFAKGYTDKLLIVEDGGESWVIAPSIFPSSSLCAVFRFDMRPQALYRVARLCGAADMFEISDYAEQKRARISKVLSASVDGVAEFCREMRLCFGDMDRLKRKRSETAQRKLILEQCHRISMLTGCPVCVDIEEGDYSSTDLPLLTAFLFTMLISARKNASDRTASISIASRAGSALVKLRFCSDAPMCIRNEMLEWQGIAADRCMAFYLTEENGEHTVEFHPHRYDLSAILGIKQEELPFLAE